MRHATSRRGGFAIIIVVSLVALLGVALAMVAVGFRSSARLTRSAADDAQLRQLLFAGERAARQRLSAGAPEPLRMPQELSDRGAILKIESFPRAGTNAFRVEAQLGNRRMAQVLRYRRDGDSWRLIDSKLE